MTRAGIAAAVVAVIGAIAASGCDRELVPSPRSRHDARDDADARRLAAQLAGLPGIADARVVVRRPYRDPLAPVAPSAAPVASILLVDTAAGDPARLAGVARELAGAALPDIARGAVHVVVAPPVRPPVVTAAVGPFEVAAGSRTALRATLAAGLLVILGLAAVLALRERRRRAA